MRMENGVKAALALVAFTAAGFAVPGAARADGTVTVKGSDTMVVLGQRWAEEFMKKNPKSVIQVTGGGSGTGISALINGTTDICEASRSMKDAEKKQLAEKAGAPPIETAVVNAVAKEKFGIGYGGAAYAKGIKVLKIKKDDKAAGILPADKTIKDGTYPLSRPLFFYTRSKPSGEIKGFVDWVLGAEGQGIVTKVGYFPIK